eukprot:scaffold2322_cov135-Cylindrotheca_fusiformis.AAC.18
MKIVRAQFFEGSIEPTRIDRLDEMDKVKPKEATILTPKASPPNEDVESHRPEPVDNPEQAQRKRRILYAVCGCLTVLILAVIIWAVRHRRGKSFNPFHVLDGDDDAFPKLEMSDTFPLGMCQGDCDTSSDCEEGLECFQRSEGQHVPGCVGGLQDDSKTDYCTKIQKPTVVESSEFPLGLCQGDCDSNTDCDEGLACFQRDKNEAVPGCDGGLEDDSQNDYCVSELDLPVLFMEQIGERLVGSPDDNLGSSVSLSHDSRILAVGAVDGGSTGYVNVYELSEEGSWRLFTTITGDEVGSEFGHSVSLSGDGKFLAVGSPKSSRGRRQKNVGKVQVFKLLWDNASNNSVLVGDDIETDNPDISSTMGFQFGYSVSISKDGDHVAVGEPMDGSISVYKISNNQWSKVGESIQLNDRAGWSISLSSNGSTIAIAGQALLSGGGVGRVFKYDGTKWEQIGEDLGEDLSEGHLVSVSLSGNARIVALASADSVHLYRFNSTSEWIQHGEALQSTIGSEDTNAPTVALSSDGDVVAIGDYLHSGVGRVRLYQYSDSSDQWTEVGMEIQGTKQNGYFGAALAVESGGSDQIFLAIGSPDPSHEMGNPGFAVVYRSRTAAIPPSTGSPTLPPTGPTVPFFEKLRSWAGEPGSVVGNSVSLSKNGRLFAYSVSQLDSKGYVESYILDEALDRWFRLERVRGDQDGAKFGHSIAFSNDGRIMAVGIPNSIDGDDAVSGRVQVFELDDVTLSWSKFAVDLDAPLLDEDSDFDTDGSFGHSVSLSEDGMILAVGSPQGYDYTSVFRFEDNEYVMMGNPIRYGKSSYGLEGWSVSLSGNGKVVAVGAPTTEKRFDEAGAGRVYEFIDGEWEQRGRHLLGEGRHDLFGTSISLSGDGSTVAIGSINYDNENGEDAGYVRIYRYDFKDSEWINYGKPILGERENDRSGFSVSLTDDGRKVAIGAIHGGGEAGQVRIFEYNEENTYWRQVGPGISSEVVGSGFGSSVSLVDASGQLMLAVGAPETLDENMFGLFRELVGEAFLYQEIKG